MINFFISTNIPKKFSLKKHKFKIQKPFNSSGIKNNQLALIFITTT